MGLIRAALNSAGSILKDQWKEMYQMDSLGQETLMQRAYRSTGKGSQNKGNDNIITNGSMIVVADGQAAMIVDNGEITEFVSEPGAFTYDSSTEPTVFCGNLKSGVKESWERLKVRFTFGADTAHDQRVYYFNTKEIIGNKFGTPNPIPFRAVDTNIGLDLDTSLRVSGTYSYKIADPVLFYKNIAGNVTDSYTISDMGDQLRSEFMQALQPAIGQLSGLSLRPSEVPAHVTELTTFMNEQLYANFTSGRGIEIVRIALNPVILPDADQETIKNLQKAATMRDPNMAAANIASAQADAMRTAAGNENGAMNGFIGMNMAMNAGSNVANLFEMGKTANNFCKNCGEKLGENAKFCPNCGTKVE